MFLYNCLKDGFHSLTLLKVMLYTLPIHFIANHCSHQYTRSCNIWQFIYARQTTGDQLRIDPRNSELMSVCEKISDPFKSTPYQVYIYNSLVWHQRH